MRFRVLMVAAVVASLLLPSSGIASAAAPPSGPMELERLDFETSTPSGNGGFDAVIANDVGGTELVNAVWGRVNNSAHAGTYSFWAAGRLFPSLAANTALTAYKEYTRSDARLNVAANGYYSVSADYYYKYPSRGDDDDNSFIVYWADSGGERITSEGGGVPIPLTTSWTKKTMPLPSSLWDQSAIFGFSFFDKIEVPGVHTGVGPSIDDVLVSGYKYGPVRNLNAAYSTVPTSHVDLTWTKPETKSGSGVTDSRSLSYRVWRSLRNQSDWTELTSSDARLSSPSLTDTTTAPGREYDYAVQAWDQGTGAGYGQLDSDWVADTRALPVASTLSGPNVPATIYSWSPFTVTGVLNLRHPAGTDIVRIDTEKSISGSWAPQSSTWLKASDYSSGGSKYSDYVSMPSPGTWRLRAVHPDDDPLGHTASATAWKTVTVTDKVYLTTPVAPSTMYKTKTYSIYGYLKPKHTQGSTKHVRIYAYRTSPSAMTRVFYASAYNYTSGGSTYTKYKASVRLPYGGKWKIRAYHPAHTGQAATYSGYDYATVK